MGRTFGVVIGPLVVVLFMAAIGALNNGLGVYLRNT